MPDPMENLERRAKAQISFFKSGIIANLIIYGAIGIVLLGLGIAVWYKMKHSGALDKIEAAKDDLAGKPAAAKDAGWDGKTPYSCGGSEKPVITGVTATAGVTANGSCELTLKDVKLTAGTAVTANGSSTVTIEGGSIEGTDSAITAGGAASVVVKGAAIKGKTTKLGGAKITGI